MATTPTRSRSPASRDHINTPPAPRFGTFHDEWEPYSHAPRKSARIQSSRATDNRTPSPNPSSRTSRSSHSHSLANTSAPRTSDSQSRASHNVSTDNMSPPATLSPQKKRQPNAASASRSVSGSLTAQSIRDAAAALGQSQKMDSPSTSRAGLALPTPAKTPTDRLHIDQTDKEVSAIARNLFGGGANAEEEEEEEEEEAPLTIKKTRTKRITAISLESFELHDDSPIEIYTDSENRLPVADDNPNNPFYGEGGIAAAAAPVRRSARHKKTAAEREVVEEKLRRKDGLMFHHRGKNVFRKFETAEAARRADMAPRLLFPTASTLATSRAYKERVKVQTKSAKSSKDADVFDDSEAETDIEEPELKESEVEEPELEEPELEEPEIDESTKATKSTSTKPTNYELKTPEDSSESDPEPPKAPKHADSPLPISRATRSKTLMTEEVTPVKSKGRSVSGGRSPFDGWRRTKNSPPGSASRKREGESLTNTDGPKRRRS